MHIDARLSLTVELPHDSRCLPRIRDRFSRNPGQRYLDTLRLLAVNGCDRSVVASVPLLAMLRRCGIAPPIVSIVNFVSLVTFVEANSVIGIDVGLKIIRSRLTPFERDV